MVGAFVYTTWDGCSKVTPGPVAQHPRDGTQLLLINWETFSRQKVLFVYLAQFELDNWTKTSLDVLFFFCESSFRVD